MSGDLRRRRLFREVNTRIREIDESFGAGIGRYHVLCECGRDDCLQRVEVPIALYDELHVHEHRFVVAPGHEHPESDRVVSEDSSYRVVAVEAG